MKNILIPPTTSAYTSLPFVVQRGERVGVKAPGLADAETVILQYESASGAFFDLSADSGELTATDYDITITASGTYRAVKTATAAAVGVSID